jgi:rod shape-determining protein MreD
LIRVVFAIFLFLFISLLQFLFIDFLSIAGVFPDLFFILLIYLSFRLPPIHTIAAGFSIGLMNDMLFNVALIGLAPLVKTIFAFFLTKISENEKVLNPLITYAFLIILIWMNHGVYNWFYFIQIADTEYSVFLYRTLPQTVYTSVLLITLSYFIPVIPEER